MGHQQVEKFSTVWSDFLASVVVFLVALPLCMGIAIASGVPEEQAAAVGILTGIIGGLVVGSLSGCPLQVSGPAAGLAVIVGQYIADYGLPALGMIILIAGSIQLLAGALGLGQVFRAMVPAVIQGMLAGIGILIFAAQFHVMVDDTPPGVGVEFGGIVNLMTIPQAVWKGLTEESHQAAAMIGVLTIVAVTVWSVLAPRRLRFFPAPLFGVVLGGLIATLFQLPVKYIDVPDNLFSAITLPAPELWPKLLDASILLAGLALAFVASAESLLTATAADALQQHASRTRYDRELAAQGVGNLCSGLLGLLPVTGVIVRTSANILAGARTRLSSILHGLWLLVFAWYFPELLRHIPIASLAAILVYTGWKLMNFKAIKVLWHIGLSEIAIYAATLGTVVVVDLLSGILAGVGLALLQLLYRLGRLHLQLIDQPERQRTLLRLQGAATFLQLPKLAAALEKIRPNVELHVDLQQLTYIDHACFELLLNWAKQHEKQGGRLVIDWDTLHARFRQEDHNGNNGDTTTQIQSDLVREASNAPTHAKPATNERLVRQNRFTPDTETASVHN